MKKHQDITDRVFGRVKVLDFAYRNSHGDYFYNCICMCGTILLVRSYHLNSGHTKSCGCLNRELSRKRQLKHGLSKTRFYRIWRAMLNRTSNPKHPQYKDYGGRGISVAKEWRKFSEFHKDMYSSYQKHVKLISEKQTTLNRINNNDSYNVNNCNWATYKEQIANSRKVLQ